MVTGALIRAAVVVQAVVVIQAVVALVAVIRAAVPGILIPAAVVISPVLAFATNGYPVALYQREALRRRRSSFSRRVLLHLP